MPGFVYVDGGFHVGRNTARNKTATNLEKTYTWNTKNVIEIP